MMAGFIIAFFVVDMLYNEESKGIDDNDEQFPNAVILAIQLDWIRE